VDFLDPRKTRLRKIQLMVGYVLVGIAILLGTVILVYGAYGYGVNTKNGDVVQNGLLFVDSKPGGSDIYLNGKPINSSTSARLVLPSGNYDLTLKKSGYRNWDRKFELDEHTITRYVYPFLFPEKPYTSNLKNYSTTPPLFMQSPDHHWLLVQSPGTDGSFEELDTSNISKPLVTLQIPSNLLTNPNSPGSSISMVEWSTDNTNVILQHTYVDGSEFIVFNRADPSKSFNINKMLNVTPAQVALRNKKIGQLYIYQQDGGTLSVADTAAGVLNPPFLRHVAAFKPNGNSIINYVTQEGMPAGKAQARIWDNGKTYPLYTFSAGPTYMIDSASYNGDDYYVAGSSTDGRVNVYKNPLNDIQNAAIGKALPSFFLKADGATKVSFSDNARFVALEGGQNFGVYDFETGDRYEYALSEPLAAQMHWMDGHRLIGDAGGKVFVMDYDSTNQQSLEPTLTNLGGYFSNNYNHLFTLTPGNNTGSVTLENIDMRAGVDLPKNPNQ
jgi:WD40 repeat protein